MRVCRSGGVCDDVCILIGFWKTLGSASPLNLRADAMRAKRGRGNTKYPSKVLVFPPS